MKVNVLLSLDPSEVPADQATWNTPLLYLVDVDGQKAGKPLSICGASAQIEFTREMRGCVIMTASEYQKYEKDMIQRHSRTRRADDPQTDTQLPGEAGDVGKASAEPAPAASSPDASSGGGE